MLRTSSTCILFVYTIQVCHCQRVLQVEHFYSALRRSLRHRWGAFWRDNPHNAGKMENPVPKWTESEFAYPRPNFHRFSRQAHQLRSESYLKHGLQQLWGLLSTTSVENVAKKWQSVANGKLTASASLTPYPTLWTMTLLKKPRRLQKSMHVEEDRLGELQLSEKADLMRWHFHLRQIVENKHAGVIIAPCVTTCDFRFATLTRPVSTTSFRMRCQR